MAGELQGKRVAILAADGVERVELEQPRRALDDAGARTELLSLHHGTIQARNHDLEAAGTFDVDAEVRSASSQLKSGSSEGSSSASSNVERFVDSSVILRPLLSSYK